MPAGNFFCIGTAHVWRMMVLMECLDPWQQGIPAAKLALLLIKLEVKR